MTRGIDFEQMEAALKRAAYKAIHGTREERSGRFLPVENRNRSSANRAPKQLELRLRRLKRQADYGDEIDHAAGAVYLNLTDWPIKDSEEVADGIVVNYDAEGRLMGGGLCGSGGGGEGE